VTARRWRLIKLHSPITASINGLIAYMTVSMVA